MLVTLMSTKYNQPPPESVLPTFNQPVAPPPEAIPAFDFGRRVGLNEESVWNFVNTGFIQGAETRDGIVFLPVSEISRFKSVWSAKMV
jgi:hypothetical protein